MQQRESDVADTLDALATPGSTVYDFEEARRELTALEDSARGFP